jgi:glycosyltransferase involved in cell wall biosynthesis
MRVFLAGTSFLPAYGGPAYSVPRLAVALADAGLQVGIWAPDQSAKSSALLQSSAKVECLAGNPDEALSHFGRPDVIHDNGIWLLHNHRLARMARERGITRLVSTRGMLEPWAVRHKSWKKRIAWHLYQHRDLRSAGAIHASSRAEAANLEKLRLGVRICTIGHGVDVPDIDRAGKRSAADGRIALFVGRIYPVKGLPMLVQAWANVRPRGWHLRIVGPDEAGHRAELEAEIRAHRLQAAISFTGPLDGADKTREFLSADLFVLPSHSESFGMAAAEALAHGLPVIATQGTPWQVLAQEGCGWWVEANAQALSDALLEATSADPARLAAMGQKGRELMMQEFGWPKVAADFAALYRSMAG